MSSESVIMEGIAFSDNVSVMSVLGPRIHDAVVSSGETVKLVRVIPDDPGEPKDIGMTLPCRWFLLSDKELIAWRDGYKACLKKHGLTEE